jgi:hypothetical protein
MTLISMSDYRSYVMCLVCLFNDAVNIKYCTMSMRNDKVLMNSKRLSWPMLRHCSEIHV